MAERSSVAHGAADWPPEPDRPWEVVPGVVHLLSPNANFMSYEGTNTWLLGSNDEAIVVDPGSEKTEHLEAIRRAASDRAWRISRVIVTHGHGDHSDGARTLANQTGAILMGFERVDPAERTQRVPVDATLADGEILTLGSQYLTIMSTPGHSTDSICLHHAGAQVVFTGDTVLGGHTGAVFGQLREYLLSLARLRGIVDDHPATQFLPGHGPVIEDPASALEYLVQGRMRRLGDVRAVVESGVSDAEGIVDVLYPGRTGRSRMPALATVQTFLDYLAEEAVDVDEAAQ